MYLSTDLHCLFHGSVAMDNVASRDLLLDFLQIPHGQISPTSLNRTDADGVQSLNNVFVAYANSTILRRLENQMLTCGLNRFHENLTQHLLTLRSTDVS